MFNKEKILEYLLSLILPKNNNILEIENMSEEDILEKVPKAEYLDNEKIKPIFKYKDKIAKNAIWEIKYNKNKKIIKKFSKILYEFILEDLSDEIFFSNFNNPLLIPVPISDKTRKERGYNQCEEILNEIRRLDINNIFEVNFECLRKTRETPHQSKLSNKTKRLNNLKNCFYAERKIIKDRNVIIIDDVTTTGATMSEISKTLKKAGAKKVIGFALGH